jgi:hypothetical protein
MAGYIPGADGRKFYMLREIPTSRKIISGETPPIKITPL